MDIKNITATIESHPMVTALGFFVVAFVFYQLSKGKSTGTAITTTPSNLPTVYETYNQAYNSYPTVATPAVTSPTTTLKTKTWQWVQHFTTNNQNLEGVAHNVNTAGLLGVQVDGVPMPATLISGMDIYTHNKGNVDAFFKAKNLTGDKTTKGTTGMVLVIPKLIIS